MLKLAPNIFVVDLALYIEKSQTLVISDIHFGYEETLHRGGIFVPKFHYKDVMKKFERITELLATAGKKIKTLILNGDLKNDFGTVTRTEWSDSIRFIRNAQEKGMKVIIVKGNHDSLIKSIAEKMHVVLLKKYVVETILIVHGDKLLKEVSANTSFAGIKTIIIGHTHPAIIVRDKIRKEKYKCYLAGMWNRKTLIVQPSFNPLLEGADISKEKIASPFLQNNIENFNVFIADDKTGNVLKFGKIKDTILNLN